MNNKHCIFKFLKYLSDWYNQCVAGALSIFSMQGCVPDIRRHGNVSRNTVPRAQYTPKGAGSVSCIG